MLGYVNIDREAMTEKEFAVYRGIYCGICQSIARRYGQLPRLTLSYDAVFLALLLSGTGTEDFQLKRSNCLTHPFQKHEIAEGNAVLDYCADMMLLLAYYKAADDREDEASWKKLRAVLGKRVLRSARDAAMCLYPAVVAEVEAALSALAVLEKEKSPSLDRTGRAFGRAVRAVFTGFFFDEKINRVLGEAGEALGFWIYALDALDDLEDDEKKGRYNPLRYRENGAMGLSSVLYHYLARLMNALDLLDIQRNKGIIDNILLLGMRARTDALLLQKEILKGADNE